VVEDLWAINVVSFVSTCVLVVTKLLVTKNTTDTQRSQSCRPDRPEFELFDD